MKKRKKRKSVKKKHAKPEAKGFLIVFVVLVGLLVLISSSRQDANPRTSEEKLLEILKQNDEVAGYMEKNPDYQILNISILSADEIREKQNGTQFRELYENLTLEDNRYVKVDLMDKSGHGLMTIIDLNKGEVVKVFGIILIK